MNITSHRLISGPGFAARTGVILLLASLNFSCANRGESYNYSLPGPTLLARVSGGYELKNRLVRLVIDDQSGNVAYWGSSDGQNNALGSAGIAARLAGVKDAPLQGAIEKRDEETWQYLGEDANKLRWRKIYCLSGRSVFVTCLVENLSDQPVDARVELVADLAHFVTATRQSDLLEGRGPAGDLRMQSFTEHHDPVEGRVTLHSDRRTLAARERFSFTMEWFLDRPALAQESR